MVIPPEVREAIAEHARAEDPNESCGLLLLRDGRAERYERARNGASSPVALLDAELLRAWGVRDDLTERAREAVRRAIRGGASAPDDVHASLTDAVGDSVATDLVERLRASARFHFTLEVDPELWYVEDEGYELGVVHSHVASPPRPSRTDVENIGLWAGRPYFIYALRTDELTAWRIERRRATPLDIEPL